MNKVSRIILHYITESHSFEFGGGGLFFANSFVHFRKGCRTDVFRSFLGCEMGDTAIFETQETKKTIVKRARIGCDHIANTKSPDPRPVGNEDLVPAMDKKNVSVRFNVDDLSDIAGSYKPGQAPSWQSNKNENYTKRLSARIEGELANALDRIQMNCYQNNYSKKRRNYRSEWCITHVVVNPKTVSVKNSKRFVLCENASVSSFECSF